MKKAVFDENGLPEAFYDSNINEEIPKSAVEITDDQWREFIDNAGERKFEDGEVVAHDPSPPVQTEDTIRALQSFMIEEVRWHVERYVTQRELNMPEDERDIKEVEYIAVLQYMQDIRDAGSLPTAEESYGVLQALIKPV